MAEETKFTEEELKQIKEIQDSYFDIQNKFGSLSVATLRLNQQVESLDKSEDELNKEFIKIQENENTFLAGITEKYGEGSLDPETGVFTPSAEFPKNN
jgi:hypothetical protein|tara:strand:- start:787 stop:1080 length:294 start_codon:yes stop_codon:yes gene_type:complete